MSRDPSLARSHAQRLNELLRQGALEEAVHALDDLRSVAPHERATHGFELELLVRRGDRDAIILAEQLIQRFPDSARIFHWAGRAYYRQHDYPKAVRWMRESSRLAPHYSSDRWLGKALTQMGSFDEAQPLLERASSQHMGALKDLAWLQQRQGETKRALETLVRYLEANPSDKAAQTSLQVLKAGALSPHDLIDQLEGLIALGEHPNENMLAPYLGALVATGQSTKAHQLVESSLNKPPCCLSCMGWAAHKLQAYDLVVQLFVPLVGSSLADFKMLNALELAARRTGKVDEVAGQFESMAASGPKALYERARRLRKAPT